MRTGVVLVGALALIASVTHAQDSGRDRLPRARLSGSTQGRVTADTLARPGSWVLLYMTPNCAPCLDVLREAGKNGHVDPSRITLVIAHDPGALPQDLASRLEWPADRVYVDDRGDFAEQLQIPGAPVILGLAGSEIHWRWSGALSGDDVRSLINSWLDSRPGPSPAGTSKR